MKRQKHDILFSLILVGVSGFLFFSLGLFAAWKLGFAKQNIVIQYDVSEPTGLSSTTISTSAVVDLNTATIEDLMKVDGIGEKTAQKIINYRSVIGQYTFIEQLLDVDGVGEKKLEGWKPFLTVGNVSTTSTSETTSMINLNTATKEDLMRIDGIGEKTAQKIIAYREQIGGFSNLEQLMEIEGIGEKKYNAWKIYLIIS